ncbi:HTH-type transcriptional regulator LutR [Antarctobacter heliothermus]|uniref:HTH-type transcriptional regulator LutR n=1 Tax=Antarctobacter heliothermus TaxID=74033 RepID=A0A222E2N5_9RHOB|nr:FCD domain-containing protein [Antarctobacter heliothermus]ASP20479.1 HTH-type transcriptional regulator LutR [Antarctobacter heliothermus]
MKLDLDTTADLPVFRQLALALQTKILSGELQPGARMPAETALASENGIHRSTVREAIRSLEQQGLLYREEGKRKLFVSRPDTEELSRRLVTPLVMNGVTFEEIWEAIRALDPVAAEAAANRRNADNLAALEDNISRTRAAMDDPDALVKLDIEFHELIALAANNRVIQSLRLPISDLFYPSFQTVMTSLNASERLLTAHEKILQAIKWGDADEAKAWMIKHINDFRKGYELASLDITDPAVFPKARQA